MNLQVLMLAAALSAGNAEFDRSASDVALAIESARIAGRLAADGAPTGILCRAMLDNPGAFAAREAAADACRTVYLAAVECEYRACVLDCARRLGIAPGGEAMDSHSREAAMAHFEAAFARERQDAVHMQAQRIVARYRPTAADFESADEAEIRRRIESRVEDAQGGAVFAENREYAQKSIVEPIVASARAERKRQGEYLRRIRSDAPGPRSLAEDLQGRLEANVRERCRKASGIDAWGVFPSVMEKVLPETVDRRLADRLAAEVDNTKLQLDAGALFDAIVRDGAQHRKASESERLCRERLCGGMLSNVVAKAAAAAEEGERADALERYRTLAAGEIVQKAVRRVWRRDAQEEFRRVRAEVSAGLEKRFWPELAAGEWYPPAELADSLSARGDFDRVVAGWRGDERLSGLAHAAGECTVTEECDARVDAGVAAALRRARSAVSAQLAIVDEEGERFVATAKAEPGMTIDSAVARLSAAVLGEWSVRKNALLWAAGAEPENAAAQHAELFPSVKRKIELVARAALAAASAPDAPAEPKPEPPEPEPPEPEPEELELTLTLRRERESVSLSVSRGKEKLHESTVGNAGDFSTAMRQVAELLSRLLFR